MARACLTFLLFGKRNMCAIVEPRTRPTLAKNASGLVELYRQFQSGFNTGSASVRNRIRRSCKQRNRPRHQPGQRPHWFQLKRERDLHVPARPARSSVRRTPMPSTKCSFISAKVATFQQDGTINDTWFGRQFGIPDSDQQRRVHDRRRHTGTVVDVRRRDNRYVQRTSSKVMQNGREAHNMCSGPRISGLRQELSRHSGVCQRDHSVRLLHGDALGCG